MVIKLIKINELEMKCDKFNNWDKNNWISWNNDNNGTNCSSGSYNKLIGIIV